MVPAVGLFRGPGACPDLGAFFRGIFWGHIGGHVEQNSVCRDTNAVDERNQPHLVFWLYFIIFLQYFPLFFRISLPPWGAACPVGYCVPFGWSGLFRCLGAQRPVARPAPGGGPAFFGRKPEERTPGRKRFFLPGPTFSGWGDPAGVLSFFCLACGPVSYARNGPPTGWAGWEGWFRGREGAFPRSKPSPWGEGGPAKPGRMRGRFGTQPFLVEVEKEGYRPSPQRNFSSAPLGMSVAPSSVTFGDSFPPRRY